MRSYLTEPMLCAEIETMLDATCDRELTDDECDMLAALYQRFEEDPDSYA
jgi:hypothetical protein